MDILALPDVFLHEMMKKVTIQDRLRIRLVCRGFEKLVANTHAGFVDHAEFLFESYDDPAFDPAGGYLSGSIGDSVLHDFDFLDGFDHCLSLRSRLFSGITIGRFSLYLDKYNPTVLEFVQRFAENIKIEQLNLEQYISNFEQFRTASQIIANCPKSKYDTTICNYLSDIEKLLALPSHDRLKLSLTFNQQHDYIVSAELFFKLLTAHNNLELSYVEMTSDDLKKALQTISAFLANAKSVYLWDNVSTIVNLIRSCGINENSVDGETCGEFVVVKTPRRDNANRYMDSSLSLHYRNCWIYIDNCKWHGGTGSCSMRFGTGEEYMPPWFG